jgi:hypothetical protein
LNDPSAGEICAGVIFAGETCAGAIFGRRDGPGFGRPAKAELLSTSAPKGWTFQCEADKIKARG